jgi:uncharacterized damage-inducible protein DinB
MEIDLALTVETLRDIPQVIEGYFKNIPETVLDLRRTEEAWTIREHLYHIASVQEMLLGRIEQIRDEERPVISPFFPETQIEQGKLYASIGAAFSHYRGMRKKQIETIRALDAAALGKEAVHEEYSNYGIPVIVNHMIFHEYWHMYRIEELWLTRDQYLR